MISSLYDPELLQEATPYLEGDDTHILVDYEGEEQRVGDVVHAKEKNLLTIYDIRIEPEFRGNGYARQILESIIPEKGRIKLVDVQPHSVEFWEHIFPGKNICPGDVKFYLE